TALLAISRRSGRFSAFFGGTSPATAEVIGKDNEQLHHRRFVIHAEERRNIEAGVSTRSPGRSRSDDKTVVGFAANSLVGKTAKQEFHYAFYFFMREPKRIDQALGNCQIAAAISPQFFVDEMIE